MTGCIEFSDEYTVIRMIRLDPPLLPVNIVFFIVSVVIIINVDILIGHHCRHGRGTFLEYRTALRPPAHPSVAVRALDRSRFYWLWNLISQFNCPSYDRPRCRKTSVQMYVRILQLKPESCALSTESEGALTAFLVHRGDPAMLNEPCALKERKKE